jgi:hypothetical protein
VINDYAYVTAQRQEDGEIILQIDDPLQTGVTLMSLDLVREMIDQINELNRLKKELK